MLEIRNLNKSFGNKQVLFDVNMKVNDKDVIGIIGPSGCGKSTLLRCINCLEKPTSGEILFQDKVIDYNKNLSLLRRHIGMVFQQFNLFDNLTVLDNIILAPVKLKLMNKEDAIKKAEEYLEKIDLLDKKDNYPKELSGGQKQRIAIVRSLMMNPKIMLFDEPTSALDPEMIGEVSKLIKDIAKKGMTMIIVSHEMNFIKSFSTKVVFMDEGRIVEVGTPKQIFDKPIDKRLKEFLSKVKDI